MSLQEIFNTVKKYAPIYFLHTNEQYYPCSMEYLHEYFERDGDTGGNNARVSMIDSLDKPARKLDWFRGDTTLNDVPCYCYITNHDNVIRCWYYMVFPYNKGKVVANTDIGNHVMDFESAFIIFDGETLEPIKIGHKYHSKKHMYDWDTAPVEFEGSHPIFYMAKGSHGVHLREGSVQYEPTLYDEMNMGARIDTIDNLVYITPQNLNGNVNFTQNSKGQMVSLSTPWTGVSNWTKQVEQIGTYRRGKLKLLFTTQYRLGGHVTTPSYNEVKKDL